MLWQVTYQSVLVAKLQEVLIQLLYKILARNSNLSTSVCHYAQIKIVRWLNVIIWYLGNNRFIMYNNF